MPNTAIWPVIPIEAKQAPPSGTGNPELWSPFAVFAYSGGDLATLKGVLGFLYWGGGHADTVDNSLYFSPFDGSGPRRLSGPYLAPPGVDYLPADGLDYYTTPSRNQPGLTVAGAPKSRHTYSGLATIMVSGKPYFICVGGALASRAGGGTAATRMFDLSQTYAQAMARPDMGWERRADAPGGMVVGTVGWDPKTGLLVTRGRNFLGAYDPAANKWTRWGDVAGGSDFEATVAMDLDRRKMYVLGDRLAEMIDLDTHALTVLGGWDGTKPIGPAWLSGFLIPRWVSPVGYPKGPGVQWHPGRKRLLVHVGGGGATSQNILQIDPISGTTEVLKMGGVTVVTQKEYGIYGRFRLIPGTDTVVLAGAVSTDVLIGQLPTAGTAAHGVMGASTRVDWHLRLAMRQPVERGLLPSREEEEGLID